MSTIKTDRNGFKSIELKLANMRKADKFTIYPYNGGDFVLLQTSSRFARLNLKTGVGIINKKGVKTSCFLSMQLDPFAFKIEPEILTELQAFLWNNKGKSGGGSLIQWDNKELFSN